MAVFGETKTGLGTRSAPGLFWGLATITVAIAAAIVVVAGGLSQRTPGSEQVGSNQAVRAQESSNQAVATVNPGSEPLLSQEELITIRLANQGLIPMAAVDWEMIELKRAVAQGWVPEQALQKATVEAEALFTDEELATIDLASKGLIPSQAVDWDEVALKQLVKRGLIPRAAAP